MVRGAISNSRRSLDRPYGVIALPWFHFHQGESSAAGNLLIRSAVLIRSESVPDKSSNTFLMSAKSSTFLDLSRRNWVGKKSWSRHCVLALASFPREHLQWVQWVEVSDMPDGQR